MLDPLMADSHTRTRTRTRVRAETGATMIELALMAGAVLTAALAFLPPVAH
jgi:hypothetical protein